MKTYSAIAVAKRFLELAQLENVGLSNMKLQKLVFFSQVVSLKMFGIPVHGNASLAWDFGPVVRELYDLVHSLAIARPSKQISLGEQDVATAFKDVEEIDDTDVLGLTRAIWKKFKSWTAFQLSDLTHRPGSPWATVYSRAQYAVIPLELIQEKGFGDGSF